MAIHRRGVETGCDVHRRHCEEHSDEAIQAFFRGKELDCFASLAMTVGQIPFKCMSKGHCRSAAATRCGNGMQSTSPSLRGAQRRSNPGLLPWQEPDCFASLAMTVGRIPFKFMSKGHCLSTAARGV